MAWSLHNSFQAKCIFIGFGQSRFWIFHIFDEPSARFYMNKRIACKPRTLWCSTSALAVQLYNLAPYSMITVYCSRSLSSTWLLWQVQVNLSWWYSHTRHLLQVYPSVCMCVCVCLGEDGPEPKFNEKPRILTLLYSILENCLQKQKNIYIVAINSLAPIRNS